MNPAIDRGRTRLLATELRWLMRLRWWAGLVMLAVGLGCWAWANAAFFGPRAAVIGLVVLSYNALLWVALRRYARAFSRFRPLLMFASLQIHLDLGCLTLLTVWTGGLASPLLGTFAFQMLFASLLQPRTRAYGTAMMAIAALGVGLWVSEQWPTGWKQAVVGVSWSMTMLVIIYLTDRVTRALYRREASRIHQLERVRGMAAELRSQQETLIQHEKMVTMGQVAAGIAHEINNPLASMDSLLQLMQRHPDKPRPDAVGVLREQVARILRIVRQLTAYAHPGQGNTLSTNLNDVVRSAVDVLAFSRQMHDVHVVCNLPDDVGDTRVNPHALQQVLMNLLINALDAVEGRPNAQVMVRTRRDAVGFAIEVADNGTGIAPELLPRIFEPFFTTKAVGHGTGLGLSICARLVRDLGGRVEVRSVVDSGTTFVVHLPMEFAPDGIPDSGEPVRSGNTVSGS